MTKKEPRELLITREDPNPLIPTQLTPTVEEMQVVLAMEEEALGMTPGVELQATHQPSTIHREVVAAVAAKEEM